jgi:hypothetical protein
VKLDLMIAWLNLGNYPMSRINAQTLIEVRAEE